MSYWHEYMPMGSNLKPRSRRRLSYLVLVIFFTAVTLLGTQRYSSLSIPELYDQAKPWAWSQSDSDQTHPFYKVAHPGHSSELENAACTGWDPKDPSTDHVDCMRARQYRQVERVLAREELGEHDFWFFTRQHNIATLRRLIKCFLPTDDPEYTSCPPKPLILAGWWYIAEVISHGTSGETIWLEGVMKQAESLGIMFIAVGPYINWIETAEMMPDVYRVIWNSDVETVSCIGDPRCVREYVPPEDAPDLSIGVPEEERGVIPIWALNVATYWGCKPKEHSSNHYWWGLTEEGEWSFQPLGHEWIMTPWPLPAGHVHLPYSIQDYCMKAPFVPHDERNDTVLMYAKKSEYFDYHYVSPRQFWTDLGKEPDFNLTLTAAITNDKPLPEGLTSIGGQPREQYEFLVGSVKALLGMGVPAISPSVYSALCQGTPVIVPHFTEKPRTDGWNVYSVDFQHGPAMMIGEPYVYSYWSKNYTELAEKVRKAISTPIGRYIPKDMELDYATDKLRDYLDRDTYAMYQQVLAKNGGQVPRMLKNTRETCYKLGRCRDELPEGRIPLAPIYP